MLKRALLALLAVPAIAALGFVAARLTPGPQQDGTTLLPSGWRVHPAGRQVGVGTLPLNLVTLSDGSVLVTNDGELCARCQSVVDGLAPEEMPTV